jgi:uncharacterized protein (TIGR02001 family)
VNKKLLAALAVSTIGLAPTVVMAQLSANIGWVSEYIFRGLYQEDSSAFAGLDYESDNGFYIGTWGADVGQGLETDLYFGYGGGSDNFSWSVGFTGYYYTDDYDDTYEEINLGIGASGLALDVALGEYDNGTCPAIDYYYAGVSYTLDSGTSFLIAQTDYDGYICEGDVAPSTDGMWLEIGHSWEFADGLEFSITALYSPDTDEPNTTVGLGEGSPDSGTQDAALVFGITKGIAIGAE